MSIPFDFPIVITVNGLQPQDPNSLKTQLLADATSQSPGLTVLPAGLIEDVSSTEVAAVSLCDQAKVDLVNSLTSNGANLFLLNQIGQLVGVQQGSVTNTSVPVILSGTIGYVVPDGFIVSDGSNSYQIGTGGPITSSGSTGPLTAIAVNAGSFAVPANTVTEIQSSYPPTITLAVNNPTAGTPGGAAESPSSFRSRVNQAQLAACVSSSRFIKTLIGQVPNVQANLISVQAASGAGLRVIVGGGDQFQVANAIFRSVANPGALVGSAINSGRNITVSLVDPPNTYPIVYVNPPVQTVTMTVTWNTTLSDFTGGGAFAGLVSGPLLNYINTIPVGSPINELEMFGLFQTAVAGLLDPTLLTRLVFSIEINGTLTPPGTGTYEVSGDPESSFFTAIDGSGIVVVQG